MHFNGFELEQAVAIELAKLYDNAETNLVPGVSTTCDVIMKRSEDACRYAANNKTFPLGVLVSHPHIKNYSCSYNCTLHMSLSCCRRAGARAGTLAAKAAAHVVAEDISYPPPTNFKANPFKYQPAVPNNNLSRSSGSNASDKLQPAPSVVQRWKRNTTGDDRWSLLPMWVIRASACSAPRPTLARYDLCVGGRVGRSTKRTSDPSGRHFDMEPSVGLLSAPSLRPHIVIV